MRLECLVESMDMKRHLKDKDGEYLEINEWKWTKFDPNGDVLVIDWSDKWPDANSGTIELRWLPDTIKSFHITGTKYERTLDVGGLPASLENLYLQRNNMDGTVDFAAVSMRMRNFVLHTNRFHGALDLRSIPPNMEYLCLQKNNFTGVVTVGALPSSLYHLLLGMNQIQSVTDNDGNAIDDSRVHV